MERNQISLRRKYFNTISLPKGNKQEIHFFTLLVQCKIYILRLLTGVEKQKRRKERGNKQGRIIYVTAKRSIIALE